MSGIAGIVGRCDTVELEKMAASMRYRGPYAKIWSPALNVHFVEVGHSDTTGPDAAIALTGPVHDAAGNSIDASTLVKRLRATAAETLNGLRGNFALAYCEDVDKGTVTLATDALSYRSLYVARLENRWAFASDYKALLALEDCPARIDRDALQAYLSSMTCGLDQPLLSGVKKLVRGSICRICESSAATQCYVARPPPRGSRSGAASLSAVREALETTVERNLKGRTRVAVTLSAGLDAASLVALIRHVRPDIAISTYTIGFGPGDYEIIGARQAADIFRTDHHEVYFDNGELVERMPRYVWMTEDLAGYGEAILQQKVISELGAAERVLFAGHGADNAFAGMPRHRLLWMIDRSPPPLRGALKELLQYTQTRTMPDSWLGRALARRAYGEPPAIGIKVLGASPLSMPDSDFSLGGYMDGHWNDMTAFEYHEPAEDAFGLTSVTPFIEHEVREAAHSAPLGMLVTRRFQKKLLRDALADLMPDLLRNRPKAIQRIPRDASLSDALLMLSEKYAIGVKLAERGLIGPDSLRTLLNRRPAGYGKTALSDLWKLVSAELWNQIFLDGRGRMPS